MDNLTLAAKKKAPTTLNDIIPDHYNCKILLVRVKDIKPAPVECYPLHGKLYCIFWGKRLEERHNNTWSDKYKM